MPTKHIPDSTWRAVEKAHVDAVIMTKESIKDTDVLNMLIKLGLSKVSVEDYRKLAKQKV